MSEQDKDKVEVTVRHKLAMVFTVLAVILTVFFGLMFWEFKDFTCCR